MKHTYCDWHILVLGYLNIWKHATFSFRSYCASCASQVALVVKNLPANARVVRDMGSIPGVGRSPGGGHGNLLLYSCLENPMDREVCQATVHRVAQNRTWLKWLSTYIYLVGSWFLDQGSKLMLFEMEAQSSNHWTSREFPTWDVLKWICFIHLQILWHWI